ncbi:MAG: hypothetical protein RSA86_04970, partial [Christensenellaceae bacterium]
GVVLSAALIFNWAILSNQIYYCMQYTYETSYATAFKIADDITEVEGYTKDTPVLIGMDEGMTITLPNAEALAPLTKYTGVLVGYIYYRDAQLLYFINNNIGLYMPVATEEQVMEIKNSQEYKEMPLYPDGKSAQMIDGVAVVKIS